VKNSTGTSTNTYLYRCSYVNLVLVLVMRSEGLYWTNWTIKSAFNLQHCSLYCNLGADQWRDSMSVFETHNKREILDTDGTCNTLQGGWVADSNAVQIYSITSTSLDRKNWIVIAIGPAFAAVGHGKPQATQCLFWRQSNPIKSNHFFPDLIDPGCCHCQPISPPFAWEASEPGWSSLYAPVVVRWFMAELESYKFPTVDWPCSCSITPLRSHNRTLDNLSASRRRPLRDITRAQTLRQAT
jgi:hypothetical protein